MLGRQNRWLADLFVAAPLSSLIPDDPILIFPHMVQACVKAGRANGETVYLDASLLRANVNWESIPLGFGQPNDPALLDRGGGESHASGGASGDSVEFIAPHSARNCTLEEIHRR